MTEASGVRITRGGTSGPSRRQFLPPLACICSVVALTAIEGIGQPAPAQVRSPLRAPALSAPVAEPLPAVAPAPVPQTSGVVENPPSYLPEYAPPLTWPPPDEGYPLYTALADTAEYATAAQSTDAISRLDSGRLIPRGSRCARTVSYTLHTYVPQFTGHDLAENCARRIQTGLKARKAVFIACRSR